MALFTPDESRKLFSLIDRLTSMNRTDLLNTLMKAILKAAVWRRDNPAQTKGDEQTAT